MPTLRIENQKLVERMFVVFKGGDSGISDRLSWEDFLRLIKKFRTKDQSQRIELLKMIDTDGNGLLSWDEIYDMICTTSLALCSSTEDPYDDEFCCKMSYFFTSRR